MTTKKKTRSKTCDCLVKMNAALEKKGSNTRLVSSMTINFSTGKATCYPVLAVEKADSKKRGKLETIIPSYCPMCGKKYEL
jgi:hypothetical protein